MNCILANDNLMLHQSWMIIWRLQVKFSIENGWLNPASISHLSVCGTKDTCVGLSALIIANIVCVLYFPVYVP